MPSFRSCAFPFSAVHVCLKYHGKLDNHHSDPTGPSLQTPMYFFLRNFSVLESFFYFCLCSQNVSQYWNWRQDYLLCWLFHSVLCILFWEQLEFTFLAAMSFDRYVAVCKPLHYTTLMSRRLCIQLVLCSWFSGFLVVIVPCNDSPAALSAPPTSSIIIAVTIRYCCIYPVQTHVS